MWVDGIHLPIRPGSITVFPPGAVLDYEFRGHSRHVYAHFHAETDSRDGQPISLLTDDPRSFPELLESMYKVVRRYSTHPLRSEILFWELLWQLSDIQPQLEHQPPPLHPVFVQAREMIELHLGEPLSVSELARELNVSHNQLTRIFRKETGNTVAAYLQMRRAKRAEHLLKDTDFSIKSVGIQVGYTDPHHFNKFIHRVFGCAPSVLRGKSAAKEDRHQPLM